jgi:hypothetical protein
MAHRRRERDVELCRLICKWNEAPVFEALKKELQGLLENKSVVPEHVSLLVTEFRITPTYASYVLQASDHDVHLATQRLTQKRKLAKQARAQDAKRIKVDE